MALLERAIFYQALLHTLVIMGAAENQSERPQLQETSARIAVACPETGDADQPAYPQAFHSAHQHARCVRYSGWRTQSRLRKSAQDDKWSFCLTAGTLCPTNQERQ